MKAKQALHILGEVVELYEESYGQYLLDDEAVIAIGKGMDALKLQIAQEKEGGV